MMAPAGPYPSTPIKPRQITFDNYCVLNRDALIQFARDGYELTTDQRLLYLAWGFANRIGHATFESWEEVSRFLSQLDKATSEVKPLSERALRDAIGRAIERGQLAGHKNLRCLIVPSNYWEMHANATAGCDYCNIGKQATRRRRLAYADRDPAA